MDVNNISETKMGQVRVGSCHWVNGKRIDPSYPGFTKIVCLTQSSEYGMLGPYCLTIKKKFSDGIVREVIFENWFQFSKVYQRVPEVAEIRSRFDRTVIWRWPSETHCTLVSNQEKTQSVWKIEPSYLKWREAGMLVSDPIRYPVGKANTHKCLFALKEDENGIINPKMLTYVESRKEIYMKEYCKLVKQHPMFETLRKRLLNGDNLLIVEVDCCQERSLNYYLQTYAKSHNIKEDFIDQGTMLVTPTNIDIMLNDTKERFGHGYCLGYTLAFE